MKENLFVDLIPRSAWFSNLRSELTASEWNLVRKKTYAAAGNHCQACGGQGSKHPVECHERWAFDTNTGVQTLIGTIALCPACHEATHMGLANVNGRGDIATQHLMKVNGWTQDEANAHIKNAFDIWEMRSDTQWTLDARWLLNYVILSAKTKEKLISHAEGSRDRYVQGGKNNL